jgi:hypothetical protein
VRPVIRSAVAVGYHLAPWRTVSPLVASWFIKRTYKGGIQESGCIASNSNIAYSLLFNSLIDPLAAGNLRINNDG